MSKHLTGSKRLQVIQNYLNGREDPDWDVLPTKKENKYIVKRRTEPLKIEPPKEEPIIEEPPKDEPKEEPKPISPQAPPTIPKSSAPVYDPTIGVEILNQLKLLGEEMKQKREKKEQKRMIKEVMQKQMDKRRYQYTIPQYIQEPNEIDDDEEIDEPLPQPILRRRNNIFSDMY